MIFTGALRRSCEERRSLEHAKDGLDFCLGVAPWPASIMSALGNIAEVVALDHSGNVVLVEFGERAELLCQFRMKDPVVFLTHDRLPLADHLLMKNHRSEPSSKQGGLRHGTFWA